MMTELQRQHAIQDIARKTGLPEGEIKLRFDRALAELRSTATVEHYLIVLASKRVRESLRRNPYRLDASQHSLPHASESMGEV